MSESGIPRTPNPGPSIVYEWTPQTKDQLALCVVEPTQPHTHTFIMLHDTGDNGASFAARVMSMATSSGSTLAQLYPGARFVFPTVRSNYGDFSPFATTPPRIGHPAALRTWIDIHRLGPPRPSSAAVFEHISEHHYMPIPAGAFREILKLVKMETHPEEADIAAENDESDDTHSTQTHGSVSPASSPSSGSSPSENSQNPNLVPPTPSTPPPPAYTPNSVVPRCRIVLGGMGTGCGAALYFAIALEGGIAGVVGLGGLLPSWTHIMHFATAGAPPTFHLGFRIVTAKRARQGRERVRDAMLYWFQKDRGEVDPLKIDDQLLIPICLCHGKEDIANNVDDGKKARDTMRALGYPVKWHAYHDGQALMDRTDVLEDIARFLHDKCNVPAVEASSAVFALVDHVTNDLDMMTIDTPDDSGALLMGDI